MDIGEAVIVETKVYCYWLELKPRDEARYKSLEDFLVMKDEARYNWKMASAVSHFQNYGYFFNLRERNTILIIIVIIPCSYDII